VHFLSALRIILAHGVSGLYERIKTIKGDLKPKD